MSRTRISARRTKRWPARVSYIVKPVTLPTFSFYDYVAGELVIGRRAIPMEPRR